MIKVKFPIVITAWKNSLNFIITLKYCNLHFKVKRTLYLKAIKNSIGTICKGS